MKRGRLIVIDGTDGSGKATQAKLLAEALKRAGHTVKVVDFPEYYKNFFGAFIGHCLSERYYDFLKVHPKIASVLYAADRWESSAEMREWLKKGYVVIANRYVSANQIHQAGKIASAAKRKAFLKWLDEMEYGVFKIPRPDVVFYLSLPISLVQTLLHKRNKTKQRAYLRRKADVHESDAAFLENSRRSALKLVKELNNFIKIDCAPKGEILPREAIHAEMYKKVKVLLKK